jgi:hypothetical protein
MEQKEAAQSHLKVVNSLRDEYNALQKLLAQEHELKESRSSQLKVIFLVAESSDDGAG